MDGNVDIAVITALKVEREAIVSRLEEVSKHQFPDEPLTFYAGYLPIDGGNRYRVVCVQAHDMANIDASIAATRTIQKFLPQCVLMVGIAGGVKGKADLGDVVVCRFCHDYELAKLTTKGREDRSRQIPPDTMLLMTHAHRQRC